METTGRLVPEKIVAVRTGIPRSTLRYWGWAGKGPEDFPTRIRVGDRAMYEAGAVEAWIDAQLARAEQERIDRRASA